MSRFDPYLASLFGMDTEYLSPKEVAAVLRCHLDTIYARLEEGSLPAYRVGRQWRIKRSDIEALRAAVPVASEETA